MTHIKKQRLGENNGSAKVTAEQVREIRRQFAAGGVSKARLAGNHNLTPQSVTRILDRVYWKDVD